MGELAKPGDPYVSEVGNVLEEEDRSVPYEVGPPKANKLTPTQRRSLQDLPTDAKTQTAINVVMMYSILGLSDNEIAHVVGAKLDDIRMLKAREVYQETFELIFHELIAANKQSLQARIASFAPKALENVMDLANDAEHELTKLKANESILDRSGLHHENLFGKNAPSDGFDSLKIVMQSGEDKETKIDIDVRKKR